MIYRERVLIYSSRVGRHIWGISRGVVAAHIIDERVLLVGLRRRLGLSRCAHKANIEPINFDGFHGGKGAKLDLPDEVNAWP